MARRLAFGSRESVSTPVTTPHPRREEPGRLPFHRERLYRRASGRLLATPSDALHLLASRGRSVASLVHGSIASARQDRALCRSGHLARDGDPEEAARGDREAASRGNADRRRPGDAAWAP